MPYADRGTHRLWYETLGREGAPPLLLVMGMSFSSRAWGPLGETLSADFRVVVFDNRGAGGSGAPLRPYGMGDLADDAAAVLDTLVPRCPGRTMLLPLVLTATVMAQSAPDLNAQTLRPTTDGQFTLWADDATFYNKVRPSARLLFQYLNDPLVYRAAG